MHQFSLLHTLCLTSTHIHMAKKGMNSSLCEIMLPKAPTPVLKSVFPVVCLAIGIIHMRKWKKKTTYYKKSAFQWCYDPPQNTAPFWTGPGAFWCTQSSVQMERSSLFQSCQMIWEACSNGNATGKWVSSYFCTAFCTQ